jgi:hypothetical protein
VSSQFEQGDQNDGVDKGGDKAGNPEHCRPEALLWVVLPMGGGHRRMTMHHD